MEVGITDARVVRLVSIGTPLSTWDFSFLEANRKPILFVHGERDEFGDVARLRELAAKVGEHAPAQLAVVAGADHFFHQHLDELKKVITEWIERQLSSEEDVARGLLPVQPLPSGEGI
jgi:alpha/beta superfamily hydrolase